MDKVVVGLVAAVVVVVAFVAAAVVSETRSNEAFRQEVTNLQSTCKVAGDARDSDDGGGHTMRTIYQCEDGKLHIR